MNRLYTVLGFGILLAYVYFLLTQVQYTQVSVLVDMSQATTTAEFIDEQGVVYTRSGKFGEEIKSPLSTTTLNSIRINEGLLRFNIKK